MQFLQWPADWNWPKKWVPKIFFCSVEHWYQAGFCIFQFQFQIQPRKKKNIDFRILELIDLSVNHIILSRKCEISYKFKRTYEITTLTVTLGSEILRTFPIIGLRTKYFSILTLFLVLLAFLNILVCGMITFKIISSMQISIS